MSDQRPVVSSSKTSIIRDYWKHAGSLPEGFEEGETQTETPIEE